MPEVRVGKKVFGAPLIHYIQDDGWSLCGKAAKLFYQPTYPFKGRTPEPCDSCFVQASRRTDIDQQWFIDEIVALSSLY